MSYITKTYLETQFKNFAEKIKSLLNNKVDKVEGKGLSTNDLTSELKSNYDTAYTHSKSAHAPSNAQANVIETVKVNGTSLTPSSKAVNITVPTNNNQLTNGAGYITSSGTAKTISDTLPISKGGTGKTTGIDAANVLINSLSTGDGNSTPTDNDYYISQLIGGGTTTATTYHRRPMSALWNYIKSKLATVATSGSYNDLTNKPTIPTVGNGTITITQNGTTKGTFTTNQSGNTTIELTDNNTTYGVATSSALGLVKSGTDITVDSNGNVSVNDDSHNHVISNVDGLQSALNVRLPHSNVNSTVNFNELTDTGVYHIRITNGINQPTATNGTLFVDFEIGSPYQIWISDISTTLAYKRIYTNNNWTNWYQLKLTDTWRGIQDNLTSDSTTDSLSAAQGKALKALVDGKAESSHTHSNYAQNAFSKVYGGGKEALIEAGTKNDSLTINPGTNISIMTDSVNKSFTITAIDTKNTAGSTDTSSKIFLVGATSQDNNPQTYSHDTAYVGTDGCLYSNNKKVSVDGHTHDDRYYTETEIDNKLNSISGTIFNNDISKKDFTYVVYSPDTLRDWIENKSGNDYTSVLIKKGTYQYTVTNSNNFVSVDKQGTLYIEGEEGSKLFITYNANVNSHYYLIRGVEKTNEDASELALDMYPEDPTNLKIGISSTSSEEISRKRMSLNNVNIYLETYAHKNTSEYYIGILRFANGVNNCRFEIKLQCSCKQTTACCYYTCTNLNNCKGITTANYDSTLTPKTGYDRLRPYYNCKRVINCYAYGSGGYSGGAFYNGDHIINCNAKFEDMYYGETFYGVNYVIGCRSYASVGTENGGSAKAYINCKRMLHNLALAGSYSNSYSDVSGNSTYLCANTLNGGWNSNK